MQLQVFLQVQVKAFEQDCFQMDYFEGFLELLLAVDLECWGIQRGFQILVDFLEAVGEIQNFLQNWEHFDFENHGIALALGASVAAQKILHFLVLRQIPFHENSLIKLLCQAVKRKNFYPI